MSDGAEIVRDLVDPVAVAHPDLQLLIATVKDGIVTLVDQKSGVSVLTFC